MSDEAAAGITIIEMRTAPDVTTVDDIDGGRFFFANSEQGGRFLFFKSVDDIIVAITDNAAGAEATDEIINGGAHNIELVNTQISTVPVD
jgi:hypothetical protein